MISDRAMRDLSCQPSYIDDNREQDVPLSTGQFRQGRLPNTAQSHFHLEPLCQILPFWRLELGEVPR